MKKEKLREYLLNNKETLFEVVDELYTLNGSLDYMVFYKNGEEFFDVFYNSKIDAIQATYYGDYNFADDYVRFNEYGSLESFNEYEKNEKIKSNINDIVDCLVKYCNDITIDDENLENLLSEEE